VKLKKKQTFPNKSHENFFRANLQNANLRNNHPLTIQKRKNLNLQKQSLEVKKLLQGILYFVPEIRKPEAV